jgi:late competence protein required for DNA uptake (superfamily II DNA/RNA helicase)
MNSIKTGKEEKMKCDRCNSEIPAGEEHVHQGQTLCEDCCMDALSTVKTCDPWAVHSAKTFEKHAGGKGTLTPLQSQIMKILTADGPMEPSRLLVKLGGNMPLNELEREFAALRHMEKVRGQKLDGKVLWRLW